MFIPLLKYQMDKPLSSLFIQPDGGWPYEYKANINNGT